VAVQEVALGNVGDVYVVDTGNNRVQRFSPEGAEVKGAFDGSETPAGTFSSPTAIAIDDSNNPLDSSEGDVYVVDSGHQVIDKFEADGKYLGSITEGAGGEPFGELDGVAVDPEGTVWVYQGTTSGLEIDSYSSASTNGFLSSRQSPFRARPGFAVDAEDNLYVNRRSERFSKINSSGAELIEELDGELSTAAAVDPATGGVFVDNVTTVVAFGSEPACTSPAVCAHGAERERFGSGHLTQGAGVGVDAANGLVYVADASANEIAVFEQATLPTVATAGASTRSEGAVTLEGTVNPEGVQVSACEFEYGTTTAYGSTAPCSPSPGSGSSPVTVVANIDLEPGHTYHYRLVAANAHGSQTGSDGTVQAGALIEEDGAVAHHVGVTEATVRALISAGAQATSYHLEYGATTAYGSSTPEASLGAPSEPTEVQLQLSGLAPGTLYHARMVARDAFGTSLGADFTFTTMSLPAPVSLPLPDGRAYELVTASSEDFEVYAPSGEQVVATGSTAEFVPSLRPVQASVSGNGLAFVGDPVPGGSGDAGQGAGNEFVASRTSMGGWTFKDVTPSGVGIGSGHYWGFSNELSVGVLAAIGGEPLTPDASVQCTTLYSRAVSDSGLHALFTATNKPEEQCSQAASPRFAGASADGSRIAFELPAALTPEAPGNGELNLYESSGGHPRLVNVLPNGEPAGNSEFGTGGSKLPGVISADGTRLFWTDLNNHSLYVRENGGTPDARTVQVDASVGGGGQYQAASTDGSRVLFTKAGELYSFDVDTETTSALALGSEVLGVVGVSADGANVYFVAAGAIRGAGGESLKNSEGEEPAEGLANFYVYREGATQFIAGLAPSDSEDWQPSAGAFGSGFSAETEPGHLTASAEVAPSGDGVVFHSGRNLTGSSNSGGIFVYDTSEQKLYCAVCELGAGGATTRLAVPTSATRLPRWISDDGSRVFFQAEGLLPQAAAESVYEWERDGAGSCESAGGCVSLLSDGSHPAVFLDASANGGDAFLLTRAHLLAGERGDDAVIYDAHVGLSLSKPVCTGTGCQGVPPAPPVFATPSSVTFTGGGNFPPVSTPGKGKPRSAAQKRAEQLKRAVALCRKKRRKPKRIACEKQALKRYGPTPAAKRRKSK
jgi:hypothetical protein